jgi:hypothetical protein
MWERELLRVERRGRRTRREGESGGAGRASFAARFCALGSGAWL